MVQFYLGSVRLVTDQEEFSPIAGTIAGIQNVLHPVTSLVHATRTGTADIADHDNMND